MVLLDLVWDQMAGLLIAMKWLNRTAQAFRPGYGVVKNRPESGDRDGRVGLRTLNRQSRPHRLPLSGHLSLPAYPGLKTWAVLLCHFMALENPAPEPTPNPEEPSLITDY
jgi:hypothetical protein